MTRPLVAAVLAAASLAMIASPAGADVEAIALCDRAVVEDVCDRFPLTRQICYHVHDPHFDFCIPGLPPRPGV